MSDKHLSLDLADRAWKDPGMGALACFGVAILSLAILLVWGFKPDLIAGWPELPSYAVVGLLGSIIAGPFFWYRHKQSIPPKPQIDPPVDAPQFTRAESRPKPSWDIVGSDKTQPPNEDEKARILGEFFFLEKPLRTVLIVLMLQDRRTFHGPCGDVYLQTLRNRGFIRLVPGEWQYHDHLHEIPDFVWSFLQSKRKELGAEPADRSIDPRNPWKPLS